MEFNKLPQSNIVTNLESYIERIKNIIWFENKEFSKDDIDISIKAYLNYLYPGLENIEVEYRYLNTPDDWNEALNISRDLNYKNAREQKVNIFLDNIKLTLEDSEKITEFIEKLVFDPVWSRACLLATFSALNAPRDAIADILFCALNIMSSDNEVDKDLFEILKVWEAGLYPIGIVDDKFVCYIIIE